MWTIRRLTAYITTADQFTWHEQVRRFTSFRAELYQSVISWNIDVSPLYHYIKTPFLLKRYRNSPPLLSKFIRCNSVRKSGTKAWHELVKKGLHRARSAFLAANTTPLKGCLANYVSKETNEFIDMNNSSAVVNSSQWRRKTDLFCKQMTAVNSQQQSLVL